MRASAALAVLMTSALAQYSNAQVTGYGTPNGNNGGALGGTGTGSGSPGGPNGIPANNAYGNPGGNPNANANGNQGGISGGMPNANPTVNNGGLSGGNPAGVPSGVPTGISAALPAASPGSSTCAASGGATTVFVTVLPTGTMNPSGLPQPDASGPVQTGQNSALGATTVLVSPVPSLQATQSVVPPFTTLTVDVWGNGPNSGNHSGPQSSGNHPAAYSNAVPNPASQPVANPNGGATSAQGAASNGPVTGPASGAAPYGDTGGLPSGPGFPVPASATASAPFSVVTDTSVAWITGSQGPTQITVLSPHTLTFGPAPVASPGPDGSVPRFTFTGPDGKPTVVAYPGGGSAQAITTGVALPTGPASGPIGSTALSGLGVTTCTSYTILGPNGIPTVIQSTWLVDPAMAAPTGLPTGAPAVPGANSGLTNALGSTTCTSYTVLGPNGLPTVVQSTWLVDPAMATPTGLPTGVPNLSGAGNPGSPNAPGSTTCTSYTILGPDGRPTIVQSTWALPNPVNTQSALAVTSGLSLPSPSLSGLLGQITPGPAVPSGVGPVLPGGNGITTCTSYTVLGPDGRPTIVDTTWLIPAAASSAAPVNGPGGLPNQISGLPDSPPLPSGIVPNANGITTCTSYTVLGPNGLPTVVDSTWVIPVSAASNTATANAVTGIPNPVTGLPTVPSQPVGGAAPAANGVTTCTSWTVLGPNGLPTVVESTFVVTASAMPAATSIGFPSAVPQGSSGLPQGLSPLVPGSGASTTCVTVGVVGPDGRTTSVVQTVVLTHGAGNSLPTSAAINFSPLAPQHDQTALPQGVSQVPSANQPTTTCITINVLGPNGIATPVVQTVVLTPIGPSLGFPTASILPGVPSLPQSLPGGNPNLNGYGAPNSGLQSILPPSAVVSGLGTEPDITLTGTITSILTVPGGPSALPPSYNDPLGNGSPFPPSLTAQAAGVPASLQYGSLPFVPNGAHLASVLQTSTWTNIIQEPTTTYTLNFPLTTMATVTVPNSVSQYKRALRRQESSSAPQSGWGNSSSTSADPFSQNTSLGASISSALGSQSPTSPSLPPAPSSVPTQSSATIGSPATPTMCASGGKIGNVTLNFDETKPGPLFNPSSDFWFSEGFVIAPPSSQISQAYTPSSGGQLIEFVPPFLSSPSTSGSRDTAEIGVGPNGASPCFRFDFHGANLGCAAQGNEKWCEFEISAYSYNESSTKEQSIAWSETKRVPACPNFPAGGCQLTPVQLDGYTNITSVLIKLHVGLDLRVWWGDDFQMGWTDNSCAAATCRANALPHRVKRETIETVAEQGVWHWTPLGLERLDDEYVWQSLD